MSRELDIMMKSKGVRLTLHGPGHPGHNQNVPALNVAHERAAILAGSESHTCSEKKELHSGRNSLCVGGGKGVRGSMWVRKEFGEHTGRGSWVPRLGRVDETSRLARPAETGTSHNTTRRPARGGARGTAPPSSLHRAPPPEKRPRCATYTRNGH